MIRTKAPHSPLRKLALALSAMALAMAGMTAVAMPARAQSDDLGKLIFGAATLFIIGKAISDANRQNQAAPVTRYRQVEPVRPGHPWRHAQPARPIVLPAACAIDTGRNGRIFYSERCLRKAGVTVSLPQQCARQINTHRGPRTAYAEECLQRAGFRTGGGRRNY